MAYIREDMADIRLTVDGVVYPAGGDSWYSANGADLEAGGAKIRPGGMGMDVSVGGPATRSDLVMKIPLTDIIVGYHKTLEQKVIEAAPAKIAITYLNRLKQPTGATQTISGTIKKAALPESDTGKADVAMYEVLISCDEQAG